MTNSKKAQVEISITTADGETRSYRLRRLPQHWKSWLLQQLPYGTDTMGVTFSRSHI